MFVAPDMIQIPIPLPFPLKFVNCYLIRGLGGWALIDTGIRWPPAIGAWSAALNHVGLRPSDIAEIYVTHYHPDHIGLAGWWQQISGAPVFITPREAEVALAVWSDGERAGQQMAELFERHGMPPDLAITVARQTANTQSMTQPLPEITILNDLQAGRVAPPRSIAGRMFQPLILPGHADEQLCLYEPTSRTLLSADHVLPRISPNISILPPTWPDPLGRYLATFDALAELDVAIVLPGHGSAFNDLRGRLRELHAHHVARLDQMHAALADGATAYDVCTRVFPLEQLSPHQIQFALGETLAHLEYLVTQGRAHRDKTERLIYRAL